jgi:hypothetical protein
MCWNQNVSLNTFMFSFFILMLIFYNNNYTQYKISEFDSIYVYLFFLSFMSMQLIEFFIWKNINNKSLNKFYSILGLLLVVLQPIISLMMLNDNNLKYNLITTYIAFSSLFVYYKLAKFDTISSVSKNGHLKWDWFHFTKYEFIIIYGLWLLFLIYSPIVNKHYKILFYVMSLFAISMYSFYKDGSEGSLWCWSINTIMIYYAFKLLFWMPFVEHGIC